jgi:type IV pilus assembly protein PilC
MPTYIVKGKFKDGKPYSGERIGANPDEVTAGLRKEGVTIASIAEKKKGGPKATGKSVPAKLLSIFVRQFSVMIDAGLPLVQCLEILGTQQENPHFAKVITATRQDVESGLNLADSMRRHPQVFDDLFCNMIAAGEAGGILDTILKRLATYIEKSVKLQAQIKGAMMYPVAVISIAALVIGVILWKVIPTFAAMFAGLGAELPLPTKLVIMASNLLVRLMPFLIIGALLIQYAFRQYYATYSGRRLVDGLLLKVPIFGDLFRKIAVSKFCRTLSTLIASGVPILDGIEITAKTAGNAVVEDALMAVRKSVEGGLTIAQPLKETKIFPGMVVQMISVGEQTGALDAMLSKVADFYEDEVDQAVANMLTLMEPVMILFLGTTVGGIVIAMYLPLFSLISQLS